MSKVKALLSDVEAGIDRLDSTIGYKDANCVPACSVCNRMKSDLNPEEFLAQIKKINDWKLE